MVEKSQLAATEIGMLNVLTETTVSNTVNKFSNLKVTQLLVTDQEGLVIYDSGSTQSGTPVELTQITKALAGNDVFTWNYHDGVMVSEVATPIMSSGVTVGCIYMMEQDAQQGQLLKSIQMVILSITLILELAVFLFSVAFSHSFSKRLNRIMTSMRIIQDGDFTHKVTMDGNDELTVLGDEFNNLAKRLQTSEHKRQQFVSDASHELKTPLASIKLLSDSILQNDMDIETIREFVGDIGEEAERLTRMSQKLLDLTRGEDVEAEKAEINYMAPTVERVVRMLSPHAKQSQLELITNLECDTPVLIREDDLYRIVFNLVENAIKYNIPGGKVTVSLERTEEWGILKVSDTGSGIPEDAIPHIFERFYRVDKARSRASGGSGLGLSIVRNMVQRNEGEIHVDSTFGMGTTFTLKFTAFDTEDTIELEQ
ncbi:MAG: HAMP domain-containing histidine kinase [Oscillospiraceae bacterium]|nr:HAMP domain-containing histidine kinase [Oscillospiraceae bacterium]